MATPGGNAIEKFRNDTIAHVSLDVPLSDDALNAALNNLKMFMHLHHFGVEYEVVREMTPSGRHEGLCAVRLEQT